MRWDQAINYMFAMGQSARVRRAGGTDHYVGWYQPEADTPAAIWWFDNEHVPLLPFMLNEEVEATEFEKMLARLPDHPDFDMPKTVDIPVADIEAHVMPPTATDIPRHPHPNPDGASD